MYVTMHPPSLVGLSCYDQKNTSLLKVAAAVLTRHFNPVLVEIRPTPPKKEEERKNKQKKNKTTKR